MARLAMHFLGTFQVLLDGEPITGFESNKDRALLAYLAVEWQRPYHREKLAALFWPQQTDKAARGNLRHSLSKLRKLIGDRESDGQERLNKFLLVSRQTIQFNQNSDRWLDVDQFNELLQSNESVSRQEKAILLYRGDFLDGCCPADSLGFDEWVLFKREQYHRQALTGLHRLTGHYEHLGQYEKAKPFAWRQVELEPWREEGHRQLMRLLARTGQRSAALAQYETCRSVLDGELNVPPALETTNLYEKIRDGKFSEGKLVIAQPSVQKVREVKELEPSAQNPAANQIVTPASTAVSTPNVPRVGRLTNTRRTWLALVSILLLIILAYAFVSRGEQMARFLDGSTAVSPALGPSPLEGKILEICLEGEADSHICVVDVETGQYVPVADELSLIPFIGGLSWSPDGQQIVFSAGSNVDQVPDPQHNDLFIISADGSSKRQLTNSPGNDIGPVWSPDGEWIAFHRNCLLWIIRPDGSEAQQIWGTSSLHCVGGMGWSSDSQKIAYLSNIRPNRSTPGQIWILNRDGSDPRSIYTFTQPGVAGLIAWSPDGQQIFCMCEIEVDPYLFLLDIDGRHEPEIVERGDVPRWWFADFWPQWGQKESK